MHSYIDFTPIEEKLFSQAAKTTTPISGTLELTPLCNMNCDMCYVRLTPEEMKSQGHLYDVDNWLNLAKQMKEAGVLFLLLTGGEPLLYPNFKKLYTSLLSMGFILSINTNGTLIDDTWTTFFTQYKPRRINISLYGSSEYAYANLCHSPEGYQKTLTAIKLLKNHGINVKLNITVTPQNISELPGIYELSKQWNLPLTIDGYMIPATRERNKPFNMQSRLSPSDAASVRMNYLISKSSAKEFSQFREQILIESNYIASHIMQANTNVSCYAGKCSFSITWNGKMHSCITLKKPEADVFHIGFSKAWTYITNKIRHLHINAKCADCSYYPTCRICVACAFEETGDYNGIPPYMCEYAKQTFQIISDYSQSY